MTRWQDFEAEVFRYLRRSYSNQGTIDFTLEGGSNSQSADIRVLGQRSEMMIEVKSPKSQCGQFVMDRRGTLFCYKSQGETDIPSDLQTRLVSHINSLPINNIDQRGVDISEHESLLCDLVKEHYRAKDVRFIITKSGNDFLEIPIEYIDQCFTFSACLRKKKSGSRSIPRKYRTEELKASLRIKMNELNLAVIDVDFQNEEVLIRHNGQFNCRRRDRALFFQNLSLYLREETSSSVVSARVKGNTNTITLIYSLEFNGFYNPTWKQHFQACLDGL